MRRLTSSRRALVATLTTIVFVAVEDPRFDAEWLAARLAEEGVRALVQGERTLRCVTHRDVGRDQ